MCFIIRSPVRYRSSSCTEEANVHKSRLNSNQTDIEVKEFTIG